MSVNQAVVFTKPVHHLGIELAPAQLNERARTFFETKGFKIVSSKIMTGSELAERAVIRQHYLMYSKASYGDVVVVDEGKARFKTAFGRSWDEEFEAGRIMDNPQVMELKGIDVHKLFSLWNALFTTGQTQKIQDGMIMAWVEELGCYCVNAFYPIVEEIFNHPQTQLDYHVVEFDSSEVTWEQFRKNILGSTDSSKADPASFRGQIYAEYPVDFPGRDNFVHGSAGPFEGLVERAIHEMDFELSTNPVGEYLAGRGVTLESFSAWKASQSITALGNLFDATEEKNTDDIFQTLEKVDW